MVTRIYRDLCSYVTRIRRRNLILATIIIIFWSSFFLFNFILKGSYIFEGQVKVSEMGFTYNGDLQKPFLQNIIGIKKLDIIGKQSQPLTLKGEFTTKDTTLNQKLNSLDKIKIEFPYSASRLILTSNNSDSSPQNDLSILELRINPNTRTNQLTYTQENQLSFCLQSAPKSSADYLCSDNTDNNPNFSNSESLGKLKLSLGKQAYILDLEQVNIPELNITSDQNRYQSLQIKYHPQTKEPQLDILAPTKIFIDLPELTTNKPNSEIEIKKIKPNLEIEIKPNSEIEIPQWFYEDLDVTDVKFTRFKQSSNVADEIRTSTIISGKVRMKDRELELETNQFLIVADDKPGIRKLRYLSINPLKPQGLQTFISGKSKGIAVGLYPEFPIKSIKPSWLSKYFSTEAIAGIISFISAFTAVVLEKILFPDNP